MRLFLVFVTTAQVFLKNEVLSRPQVQLPSNATQQAANAFQSALQNGVDLPRNLQNSLQNIQNTTSNNGVDLPVLGQILGQTSTPNANLQPDQNFAQNIPSSSPSPTLQNLVQNIHPLPNSQATQRIPANLAQSLPTQSGQNLGQQLSNLSSVLPNIATNFPTNLGQPQNLPQFSQNPLLNSQNSSSLFSNLQRDLSRFPSPNQGGNLLQNSGQLPSLNSAFGQNRPSQNMFPDLQRSMGQFPSLNQEGSLLPNSVQLPQLSSSFPSLTSAFGQNTPTQNIPGSIASNSSLMNFELEEENNSQVSTQRGGQANNPGDVKAKIRPLIGQNLQQGGLLGNLQQFTGNQLQTTRDALLGTKRNLLETLKLRNAERKLLRQQQRLGLLGGNGGIGGGLLGSGLGILSGSPFDTSENETSTATVGSGGLLGQRNNLLGLIGKK